MLVSVHVSVCACMCVGEGEGVFVCMCLCVCVIASDFKQMTDVSMHQSACIYICRETSKKTGCLRSRVVSLANCRRRSRF